MNSTVRVIHETELQAPPLPWEALLQYTEKELGHPVRPLTLIFITAKRSKELNARYRQKNAPTNVLSFPEDREVLLALQVAEEEARTQVIDVAHWMTRLLLHGILHLEGYTHDTGTDARRMEKLEDRILSQLGIVIPGVTT